MLDSLFEQLPAASWIFRQVGALDQCDAKRFAGIRGSAIRSGAEKGKFVRAICQEGPYSLELRFVTLLYKLFNDLGRGFEKFGGPIIDFGIYLGSFFDLFA